MAFWKSVDKIILRNGGCLHTKYSDVNDHVELLTLKYHPQANVTRLCLHEKATKYKVRINLSCISVFDVPTQGS